MSSDRPVSHLPPPPPIWPRPAGPAGVARRTGTNDRVLIVPLATAGIGWAILLFGLYAEADTGSPDGTACTGVSGAAYQACMRQEESRTLIVWSLALGLAAVGLATLMRSRHMGRSEAWQRVATAGAALASASLAVAAVAVWVHGAGGGFYDDAFGPLRWNLTMAAGLVVGTVAGLLFGIGEDPNQPPGPPG